MKESLGLRLHHVGYAVKEIAEVARKYVETFGYAMETPVIHDPAQTALVQFLKLAGDQAYLEFVAPDGPASRLSNSVNHNVRLNHLCYAAGPLEETIAHLEASKFRVISDPKPGVAFGGRRICWVFGSDNLPIELVERRDADDPCVPGL